MPAYDSTGTNYLTTSSAANEANRTRGFHSDQNNVSSNVDLTLGNSGYLSARGGYFYDSYKDTGVPSTTSYTYQVSNIGMAGIPVSLQGPVNTANTPRIQITNFDTTSQGFFQLDYNHAFKGGHLIKGGWGVRRSVNDVGVAYPGGYTYLYWGQSFRSTATGQTGTGTYGYYRVDDLATRGKVQREHPEPVRAGHVDGRLTADAESRASAPRTRRSRPSGRTSRSTRFSSASATSSRRGWARPTTCAATGA